MPTFVYGDRVKPDGTATPDQTAVTRHKRILMTDQVLEEGDNMAVGLHLSPDKVYLGKAGAAHGSPAVLYAMVNDPETLDTLDELFDDIDSINDMGLSSLPSEALTISRWNREFPAESSFPGDFIIFDNSIHGGFSVFAVEDLFKSLELKTSNKTAYGRWLMDLISDLTTTDQIDHTKD